MSADGCPCGGEHSEGAVYFVSVRRNETDWVPVLGPYGTHPEALALVDKGRELTERVDPRAHWYAFGTVALPGDTKRVGLLNDALATETAEAAAPKQAEKKRIAHYRHGRIDR